MANVTLGTLRDYWKALSDIIKTGEPQQAQQDYRLRVATGRMRRY